LRVKRVLSRPDKLSRQSSLGYILTNQDGHHGCYFETDGGGIQENAQMVPIRDQPIHQGRSTGRLALASAGSTEAQVASGFARVSRRSSRIAA
jgi:hypothetical protein